MADRDYKLGIGDNFESGEEKRLWFMQNYSYDTSSEKVIDKEIVDALIAYQKYMDDTAMNLESYHDGNRKESYVYTNYGTLSYVEKKNLFTISEGRIHWEDLVNCFITVTDDEVVDVRVVYS